MTETRRLHRAIGWLLMVPCCLALVACGTSVIVQGTLPTPIVEKIPLRIGVHYTEEFARFTHEERISEKGTYRIDIGAQNHSFFRTLFESMFEQVVEVPKPPLGDEFAGQIDGILVPEIEKYGFLSPHISGLNFYSASIHYRMRLYDLRGVPLAEWQVVGYGKSPKEGMREGAALSEATMLAIRDGGARIAVETRDQPKVASWLKEKGIEL